MPVTVEFKRKDGSTYSVEKNFGATLEESVALFGSEVVHAGFVRMATTDLRNRYRNAVEQNAPNLDESIQAWEPGKGSSIKIRVDPVAAISKKIESGEVTLEQLEAWRAQLLAQQG